MRYGTVLLSIFVLSVLVACTSKPLPRSQQEPQPNATGNSVQGNQGANQKSALDEAGPQGSGKKGDFDEIAKRAELEETKRLQKATEVKLPAGTMFYVHLLDEVGSKVSKPGDDFNGTLAAAVTVGNQVVIPAGASVTGRVLQAKPAGRFKGGAILSLELRSVVVNGKKHLMHTEMVTTESKGKGKRTAGMVAGGAAGGAAIGAAAGGGKGAAIGASVGTATGLAGAALTGKHDITLPVEALVAFRLSDVLEVKQNDAEALQP